MAELTFEQFLAETKESEKRREAKENVLIKKETKTFNELQEKLDMFDELTASKEQIEDAELTKAQITQIQEDRKYREEENKFKSEEKINFERQETALAEMAKAIEAQGGLAEKNDDYIKAKQELEKKVFQAQLREASPGKRKELLKEEAARNKKNLTVLQRISVGIRGLGKKFMEGAGKALDSSFLKGAALIALLFLLPKVLNSEIFKKGVKFIETTVIPLIKKFVQFLEDSFGPNGPLVAGLLGVIAILKPSLIITPIRLAVKALSNAFKFLRYVISGELRKDVLKLAKGISTRFGKVMKALRVAFNFLRLKVLALSTAVMSTVSAIGAAIAPLLAPAALIVAIVAGIVAIFYSLNDAFNQFSKTLEETGSVAEAIKAAISRFFATLIALPAGLFIKLIGFVAKLFGFEEVAKNLPTIGELSDIIFGGIMQAIDFVQDLFAKAFDFLVNNKVVRGIRKLFGKTDEELEAEELEREQERAEKRNRRATRLKRQQNRDEAIMARQVEAGSDAQYDTVDRVMERQRKIDMLEGRGEMQGPPTAPVIINNDSSIRSNSSNTQSVNETITSRDGMLISAVSDF